MLAQRGIGARASCTATRGGWRANGPVFGWGMGSFPTVFALYNTQEPNGDRIPVVYHDAHSDWLQSVAEIGLAGTALIGAAVLLPFSTARRSRLTPIPCFLLAGCTLVGALRLGRVSVRQRGRRPCAGGSVSSARSSTCALRAPRTRRSAHPRPCIRSSY